MAPSKSKKRKLNEVRGPEPSKKLRKQQHYSSPSSSEGSADESTAIDPADSNQESGEETEQRSIVSPSEATGLPAEEASDDSVSTFDSESGGSDASTNPNHEPIQKNKSKRNDPTAMATSISAILTSNLSRSKRVDPILSRSVTASQANTEIVDSHLEKKIKRMQSADKKKAMEKGHVEDVVLGINAKIGERVDDSSGGVGEVQELERRLRKTAQRGVVKLFNAVRLAQVRGEEAAKAGGSRGRKEERVGEMSKKGFLELVASGGQDEGMGKGREVIEEA